jgi:hypothetical protein
MSGSFASDETPMKQSALRTSFDDKLMQWRKSMDRLRSIVAATTLAIAGALAGGTAQAAVIGLSAIGPAADAGAIVEPVQFRWGGYDYCWYPDGWRGPGWYWCGYAYRVGLGWGGPVGWNGWRFVAHDHDRDDFRFHHDRDDFRFRDHDRHDHDHDHDRRDRY